MSHRRGKAIAASTVDVKPKKLSQVKDKDEKRFMIDDAFHTLKNLARVEREVEEIKADPELFTAAQAKIDQAIADLVKVKS